MCALCVCMWIRVSLCECFRVCWCVCVALCVLLREDGAYILARIPMSASYLVANNMPT